MSNIFELGAVKCPPGGKAIHPDFGWCEVLAADGMMRTVAYEIHTQDETLNLDDLPEGVSPDEVVFSENICHVEVEVDVRDLREVNPTKDMQPRGTASQVLFRAGKEPYVAK